MSRNEIESSKSRIWHALVEEGGGEMTYAELWRSCRCAALHFDEALREMKRDGEIKIAGDRDMTIRLA